MGGQHPCIDLFQGDIGLAWILARGGIPQQVLTRLLKSLLAEITAHHLESQQKALDEDHPRTTERIKQSLCLPGSSQINHLTCEFGW